jgi:penicillin-binding protein 1A
MHPVVARAALRAAELARGLGQGIRRRPVLAASFLPLLALLYVLALVPFTPGIGDLSKAKSEVPAVVVSADGVVLAEYKRINRRWVALDRMSAHVVNALIATEDHRFYEHRGIDVRRTAAAVVSTLKGQRQGGSTITQQLARNLYPEEIGRAPTVSRKVKEAITALKVEAVYTKHEILETYLNTVPFLYNAFGIEMAARTYFDKSADRLDVLESATLIGMLKGTSAYNPVTNPERAVARRNVVLAQMARHGTLPAEQLEALQKRPLRLNFERQIEPLGVAPHVAQLVRKWLIEWADRNGYNIYADGLVVRTTISSRHQKAANLAVARNVARLQATADAQRKRGQERQLLQAGFLAMDPRNGHIRAWVGSPDFAQTQFDHVGQARRQPGSTFKPFVYGAAFAQGLRPSSTFVDQHVSYGSGRDVWTPMDATPPSGQPMSLRDALVSSKNTVTAQLMQEVGPARVAKLAQAMGVRQSKLDLVPSLALGTSPVTLREMVAAYGTIANSGAYVEPLLILRVEDRTGRTLEGFVSGQPEPALQRSSALALVDVLRGVVDEGTGVAIRTRYGIQADVAGKTGTTQDNTDGWFILMHPQLVAGAWVGYDDNRMRMGEQWGQGARSALPIVGDYFQQSLRYRWIDAQVEFEIPRPRPAPPPPPRERPRDPLMDIFNEVLGRILRQLQ